MDNNKKKKESPVGGIILAVIALWVAFGDAFGEAMGIIVVVGVIALVFFVAKAAKKRQETEGGTAQVTGEDVKTAAKAGFSKLMTEAKKMSEYEDCDDDHEDVDPSEYTTEDEKRVKQLKSMLKNGIIDKEEYNIMLKRYKL